MPGGWEAGSTRQRGSAPCRPRRPGTARAPLRRRPRGPRCHRGCDLGEPGAGRPRRDRRLVTRWDRPPGGVRGGGARRGSGLGRAPVGRRAGGSCPGAGEVRRRAPASVGAVRRRTPAGAGAATARSRRPGRAEPGSFRAAAPRRQAGHPARDGGGDGGAGGAAGAWRSLADRRDRRRADQPRQSARPGGRHDRRPGTCRPTRR